MYTHSTIRLSLFVHRVCCCCWEAADVHAYVCWRTWTTHIISSERERERETRSPSHARTGINATHNTDTFSNTWNTQTNEQSQPAASRGVVHRLLLAFAGSLAVLSRYVWRIPHHHHQQHLRIAQPKKNTLAFRGKTANSSHQFEVFSLTSVFSVMIKSILQFE